MLLVAAVLGEPACREPDLPAPPDAVNIGPRARSAPGTTYKVDTLVSLDGSASFDPDGDIRDYYWTVVERPAGSMTLPVRNNVVVTSARVDRVGTYRFRLTVTDAGNLQDSCDLHVEVVATIESDLR